MRAILAFSLVLATALPAAAQDVDENRAEAFLAAVEGNGCTVMMADAASFFPSNGFTDPNETRAIVGALVEDAAMIRMDDMIQAVTEACPFTEPNPARVEAFVAVLEENGCSVSRDQAAEVFPANGFTIREETRAIAGILIGDGRAQAGDSLRVISETCPAS